MGGGLPSDQPKDWPAIAEVERYNRQVRARLDERLRDPSVTRAMASSPEIGTLLQVAIEHRLMHAETLAYLLHNLPLHKKLRADRTGRRCAARSGSKAGDDSFGNCHAGAVARWPDRLAGTMNSGCSECWCRVFRSACFR